MFIYVYMFIHLYRLRRPELGLRLREARLEPGDNNDKHIIIIGISIIIGTSIIGMSIIGMSITDT